MIAGLTACSSKKQKFEFDHAQEAIAACHQELATVKAQKDGQRSSDKQFRNR